MSKFSGRCDLADHIMMEKMYDKGTCKVSDELECFELFKERTGGVIYQHKLIEVNRFNEDLIKDYCEDNKFKVLEPGKLYEYWDEQYTLKQLNKKGVYITVPIYFNTLLDIIPYYPYVINMCFSSDGKERVYIANKSDIESEQMSALFAGYTPGMTDYYRKHLQEHYLEVCKQYFLYKLPEREREIGLQSIIFKDDRYLIDTGKKIDYMHDLEYVFADGKKHSHWTSPKIYEENYIEISKQDIELLKDFIKSDTVKVKYVESCEFPKYLD